MSGLDKGFGIWQRVCGLGVLCATLGGGNLLSEIVKLLKGATGGRLVALVLVARHSSARSEAKKRHRGERKRKGIQKTKQNKAETLCGVIVVQPLRRSERDKA